VNSGKQRFWASRTLETDLPTC